MARQNCRRERAKVAQKLCIILKTEHARCATNHQQESHFMSLPGPAAQILIAFQMSSQKQAAERTVMNSEEKAIPDYVV
jgi:hypothetical protein